MTDEQAKEIVERIKREMDYFDEVYDMATFQYKKGLISLSKCDEIQDRLDGIRAGYEKAIEIVKEVMGDG